MQEELFQPLYADDVRDDATAISRVRQERCAAPGPRCTLRGVAPMIFRHAQLGQGTLAGAGSSGYSRPLMTRPVVVSAKIDACFLRAYADDMLASAHERRRPLASARAVTALFR